MPEDINPLDLSHDERLDLFGSCADRVKGRLDRLEDEFKSSRSLEEMVLGKEFTSHENDNKYTTTDGLPYMLNRETSSLMVCCVAHRSVIASIFSIENDPEMFQRIEKDYDDLVKAASRLFGNVVKAEAKMEG